MLKKLVVSVSLIVLIIDYGGCTFSDEKTRCKIRNTNTLGTCKPLHECTEAINGLKETEKLPQFCRFEEYTPIVCCPNAIKVNVEDVIQNSPGLIIGSNPKKEKRIGEISRKKCEEYSKLVNITIPNPVAMIGAAPITRYICTMLYTPVIIGGETAREHEFPHMALIGYVQENDKIIWACGGSLISEQYVLTAGHCLSSFLYGPAKYVRLGINNKEERSKYVQQRSISELIKHPKYRAPSHYNDIALLKLESQLKLHPRLRPACLYTDEELNMEKAVATGWGTVGFYEDTSDDLLKVTLKLYENDACNESYKSHINRKLRYGIDSNTQICAGTDIDDVKDTCQGDSGGPLQIYNKDNCTYEIIGITSFGKACGLSNAPGVYTKVSSYIEWIEQIVWPSNSDNHM